jgi:hypothetical protein
MELMKEVAKKNNDPSMNPGEWSEWMWA